MKRLVDSILEEVEEKEFDDPIRSIHVYEDGMVITELPGDGIGGETGEFPEETETGEPTFFATIPEGEAVMCVFVDSKGKVHELDCDEPVIPDEIDRVVLGKEGNLESIEILVDEEDEIDEEIINEVKFKRVIRKGKKVKKLLCGPNRINRGGRCVRMTPKEKRGRRLLARQLKRVVRRTAKLSTTKRRIMKGRLKRKRLGLK